MYCNDGFGDLSGNFLKNVGGKVSDLGKALSAPGKAFLKKPRSAFNLKKQWKMGTNIGKAAEATMVSLNPLDRYLERFDEAGIKEGRKKGGFVGAVGKFLGRTGETARQKPIATTLVVYSAVLGVKSLLTTGAKGAAGAAAGAGGTGSAGTGVASTVTATSTGTATAGGLTATEALTGATGIIGTASKVANMVSPKKKEEVSDGINYDDYDEQLSTIKKEPVLMGMVSGKNIALFIGLGSLTAIGYLLFNPPRNK